VNPVSILIIDDDEGTQTALRYVLDSEGWKLRVVPQAHRALAELASSNWTLVIVNVALIGLDGPVFSTLKELALADPIEAGRTRARVLFLVPESVGEEIQPVLERERLPYALKPFHLHDFLDKISDLLLETQSISTPIRRVRYESKDHERQSTIDRRVGRELRSGGNLRQTAMFAGRGDYMMTEEEIAEFEQQEAEERKKSRKPRKDLGRP
jgi:DNA-binding response OmpR family regulator